MTLEYLIVLFDRDKKWIVNNSWSQEDTCTFGDESAFIRIVLRDHRDNDKELSTNRNTGIVLTMKEVPEYNSENDSDLRSRLEMLPSSTRGSINQIARIGWLPYTGKYPQQTLLSYSEAYRNGCRIMLCDVQVTRDGKYVCFHDDTINHYARNVDGSEVHEQVYICDSTLDELNEYDYGLYKSEEFKGTKLLTLDEFCRWCSLMGVLPMIETKVQLDDSQVNEIAMLLKKNGLGYNSIIADDQSYLVTNCDSWIKYLPNAMYCVRGGSRDPDNAFICAKKFADNNMRVSIGITSLSTFDLYAEYWMENNIEIEYSEIKSIEDLQLMVDCKTAHSERSKPQIKIGEF